MKRIAMLFALVLGGCTHVDAGNVGVKIDSCSGGGVDGKPLGVGYYATGPCTSIEEFPIFQQTLVLTKNPHEGPDSSPPNADESISVTSSEGMPIDVDVSMSFTVDPAKAPAIYTKYRKSLEHIQTTFFRQAIREALQETFSKYTAQQLYSDKKEGARAEVQKILVEKLVADGFVVTQFTINATRVPESVTNAINAKVAMAQEAQKAEQEVRKTEALAKQRVAQAEGEAAAVRLKADAEAYANQKLTESVSPVLVEYLRVQKWDGHLSQVSGAAGTMLNLGAGK